MLDLRLHSREGTLQSPEEEHQCKDVRPHEHGEHLGRGQYSYRGITDYRYPAHLVPVAVPRQPAGQQGPHRGTHGARPVHDGGDGGEGAAAAHQRAVRAQLRGHRGRDQGVGAVNQQPLEMLNSVSVIVVRIISINNNIHD